MVGLRVTYARTPITTTCNANGMFQWLSTLDNHTYSLRDSSSPLIVVDNVSKTDNTQITNQDYVTTRTHFNTKNNLNKNDVPECDIPVKKERLAL
ncbi:unnamed protein product [Schistosoma mattheei]|uniref:Uncharacterized protein n=1 Tax=Schistosoma mattheei TaxID=31246 RepID=A0A183NJH3_9TREM|nr:unnamed protein product [Schistosoma mattheei]